MPLHERAKNILSFVFRIGLSSLLLWYLSTKIDKEKTIEVLKTADLTYIYYAGAIFLVINFVILYRWALLIRALDLSVSFFSVTRYFFIGLFGNLFLPTAIGGDIIKIIGLCRETPHKPKVVASVILDRLSGYAAIVTVAVCSFIFGYRFIGESSLLAPIVIMAGVSITVATVLFNERAYSFGCKVFMKFPRIEKALMDVHYDIALLKGHMKEGYKAVGLSCLAQCGLALCFYLTARALHQDIGIIYFLIFVPIICVAAAFPSIGGLGFREAGAAYLFAKIGVASGIAVSLSLINFLFMIAVGLIGGVIYVFTLSSGRIQYHQPDANVKPNQA